jgi:hypothetical protein
VLTPGRRSKKSGHANDNICRLQIDAAVHFLGNDSHVVLCDMLAKRRFEDGDNTIQE